MIIISRLRTKSAGRSPASTEATATPRRPARRVGLRLRRIRSRRDVAFAVADHARSRRVMGTARHVPRRRRRLRACRVSKGPHLSPPHSVLEETVLRAAGGPTESPARGGLNGSTVHRPHRASRTLITRFFAVGRASSRPHPVNCRVVAMSPVRAGSRRTRTRTRAE